MRTPFLSRFELQRRQRQLQDLQHYAQVQEADFSHEKDRLATFLLRYSHQLGPLYAELDEIETQLHVATRYLCEALRRNGVQAPEPKPAPSTALPQLPELPRATALPPPPSGDGALLPPDPLSLKQLYRRAAMRLHPDRAPDPAMRQARQQQMTEANLAYAQGNRAALEKLLLDTGDESIRPSARETHPILEWIRRCEHMVQERLHLVQTLLHSLRTHPMHQLMVAIEKAEAMNLKPLDVMAERLHKQIAERRKELYIGQRLHANSSLAPAFVARLEQSSSLA